eukprot:CAMPEP_0185195706 /NCGR_PEP_ID=MMETSP1140-20130426/35520_1 /TAXON_ID=298111 /ORGANISM="Pavlova sp., Strain CCMP459" /LENGTH=73 /DNA_ID=CAMNT_0027762691 /DNA_START=95 /DNA_END=316 /DNA_ORIENTATION=+
MIQPLMCDDAVRHDAGPTGALAAWACWASPSAPGPAPLETVGANSSLSQITATASGPAAGALYFNTHAARTSS